MMRQRDLRNMGTSLAFGELHRDESLNRKFPNPVTKFSHINLIIWELWMEGHVPVDSRPLI